MPELPTGTITFLFTDIEARHDSSSSCGRATARSSRSIGSC
jgi:hypothetical protein